MKRILSIAILVLMLLALCLTACAEETEPKTYTSGDYRYILLDDGTAEITWYNGKAENLTIAAQLDGYPVTAIGDGVFSWRSSLTAVSIPDSVTAIGDGAFAYCFSLTVITIPDSVTRIGDSAFSCCSSLTAITIPDSVTSIGDSAFFYCSSLTLTVTRDSYAAQYCKEKGLNYTYTDSLDWLNN